MSAIENLKAEVERTKHLYDQACEAFRVASMHGYNCHADAARAATHRRWIAASVALHEAIEDREQADAGELQDQQGAL